MEIPAGDEDDIEATRTEIIAHLNGVSADMENLEGATFTGLGKGLPEAPVVE